MISIKGVSILHGGEAIVPSKIYKAIIKGAITYDYKFDKIFFNADMLKKLPPIIFTFDGEVIFERRAEEDMVLEMKTAGIETFITKPV